jgi:hypothetical protein
LNGRVRGRELVKVRKKRGKDKLKGVERKEG